ncbi:MAG: Uncharacterized protein G01um101429_600 [Parcubacteria group bacterium Gr01-1014_29]|nr:MAG: Uncharacterized protein G01um101429_600 [Parcubacteria group bacterium Gr01-1014_29]
MFLQNKILLLLFIAGFVALGIISFHIAHAQEVGIVPCGYGTLPPCNLCHFYNLAKNGIDFMLFRFLVPLAVIALLIGGIYLLASRGNPQMIETGKNAITNTVIGILIAFAAWLVIATILNTLGYQGFTPGWSDPPVCVNPIRPLSGGGIVRESCETPSSVDETCKTTNNTPGIRVCTPDRFFTQCMETCTAGAEPSTCDVGGCAGTRTCGEVAAGKNARSACTQTDPQCVPQGGGNCPGQAKAKGDPIISNGKKIYRSIGLFQINLSANNIAGISPPCPTAFEGANRALKPGPEAQALYDRCVAAAEDPATNIAKACELRTARGSWADWSRTVRTCNL